MKVYTKIGTEYKYYYGEDTLRVIPENCSLGICVKWSDLDSITEFDSYYKPEYFGDEYKWDSEIIGDTITSRQLLPGCDDGHGELKLKFKDRGPNNLPEFLELTKFNYCFGTVWGDTLTSGIIKLQDWNTNGILIGIILSELKPPQLGKPDLPTRRVFWINFTN